MGRHNRLMWVAVVFSLAAAGWSGQTRAKQDQHEARRLRETGQILPAERIVERAKAAHPGKLLDMELDRDNGRYVYELELLDEHGVVWELKYDAATGALLEREEDN
jgi:uncharacterized membrane protein YkoI